MLFLEVQPKSLLNNVNGLYTLLIFLLDPGQEKCDFFVWAEHVRTFLDSFFLHGPRIGKVDIFSYAHTSCRDIHIVEIA